MSKADGRDDYVRQGEFDTAMTAIKADFDTVNENIDGLRQDVDGLRQDVDGLRQDVDGLRQDVDGLRQDVDKLQRVTETTLLIVQEIDKKLSVIRNHEERISYLEERVFPVK